MAFKQKLLNKSLAAQQEPFVVKVKQEIKTEPAEMNFSDFAIEPNLHLIKQENIKTELIIIGIDPDPQHDITSPISEPDDKRPLMNRNKFKSKNSVHDFSSKPFPPKPRYGNGYRKKYTGQRRTPMLETAFKVHRYLSSKNPNSLTRRQLDSLTWAESVISGNTLRRRNNSYDAPAPIEIPDDNNNHNELNDAFIHNETIQVIPDTFQLAVVDFANPGGRYSLENARIIEKTLSKSVATYILENPEAKPPIFGKSVYFDGVLVLDCKDQAAYDFARLILWDIKLWDGSKLKLMEPQKTPFDSIGSLHTLDVGIVDKNKVLDILKSQNPLINMDNWKMLGETRFKSGHRQYSIKICNPPIYFLKHKQLRLHLGGSEVILKNFGCEWLWNCKV